MKNHDLLRGNGIVQNAALIKFQWLGDVHWWHYKQLILTIQFSITLETNKF